MSVFTLNFRPGLYFELTRPKVKPSWWKYVIQAVLYTIRCEKHAKLWHRATQAGRDIFYDIVKNGEDKRRREDDWKKEINNLKEENKTLRKVVKAMLQPIVRYETGSDDMYEQMELVSIDDGFSSIDERFDRIYYGSKIQFENPGDDEKLKNENKVGMLRSPYEPKPAQIIINSIKAPTKIVTYKPFKRDPLKNPNYLEQEEMRKKARIKVKNQKILARAEKLVSLETQSTSGAEDESVASRPASGAASEHGQVILLKVSQVSATLFRNDFIDTSSAIGVTLCIKIGTHKFGLKSRLSGNPVNFNDNLEMDVSLQDYNTDLHISVDAEVVYKSGSSRHLGGGSVALRSLVPEFNIDVSPVAIDLHHLQDMPHVKTTHARNHANRVIASISMSSKIVAAVGPNIASKTFRAEKVLPRSQTSARESEGRTNLMQRMDTTSVISDLQSVSSNDFSISSFQPNVLPPLHSGGSETSLLRSSCNAIPSNTIEPTRSTMGSSSLNQAVGIHKKKILQWARALDDFAQDDSISILTSDESLELKSGSRSHNLGDGAPRSSYTRTRFPEIPSPKCSTSPSNGFRSRSSSPSRFEEGESTSSGRKQSRHVYTGVRNVDTDSRHNEPTAIATDRQVCPEKLPANEQKALEIIMDVRKRQKKGKKFENRPLTKVEVNLLHSPFAAPVRLLKDSSLSSMDNVSTISTTAAPTKQLSRSAN